MPYCEACGEFMRTSYVSLADEYVVEGRKHTRYIHYCKECSDEIFLGKISTKRAKLDSSSPGAPIDGFDSSPSQENAIRIMEDGQ